VVRGLATRDLDAIVAVVEQARALPLEQCPGREERIEDPPQLALVAGVLIAVLGDVSARMHLAANLVASNNDVREVVRARLGNDPLPDDLPLTQGWRAKHILPELLAVLDGGRRLRIADPGAEAPFAYEDAADRLQ
jgi:ribonuclease D